MKSLLVVLTAFSLPALAHQSHVAHTHPHGLTMLPEIAVVIGLLVALAAGLLLYWKFVGTPRTRRR
jgi:hypothetical protein